MIFLFFTLNFGENFSYSKLCSEITAVEKNSTNFSKRFKHPSSELNLRIDALFEHFNQCVNKISQICQVKILPCTTLIH